MLWLDQSHNKTREMQLQQKEHRPQILGREGGVWASLVPPPPPWAYLLSYTNIIQIPSIDEVVHVLPFDVRIESAAATSRFDLELSPWEIAVPVAAAIGFSTNFVAI
ncbi:hypothetical protein PG993_011632 [Apiospora rasikravindrae]|uniref:Uncharacterized protein n=1 Tax=Apiospora rasikravindrae TaxID=990691 RepID=A0ABR1S060_9PEZI